MGTEGDGWWERTPVQPQLPHQHPSPHQREGNALQDRGLAQVAGKRLLARLVPEQCTAGISADVTPQKRPSQQRPFGHPPRSRLRTDLVKTEQHERPQIDQRKQAKGIGEGEVLHGSVNVPRRTQQLCLVFVFGHVRHEFPRAKR
jgi:hypothetical protein